eukprot:g871.t1
MSVGTGREWGSDRDRKPSMSVKAEPEVGWLFLVGILATGLFVPFAASTIPCCYYHRKHLQKQKGDAYEAGLDDDDKDDDDNNEVDDDDKDDDDEKVRSKLFKRLELRKKARKLHRLAPVWLIASIVTSAGSALSASTLILSYTFQRAISYQFWVSLLIFSIVSSVGFSMYHVFVATRRDVTKGFQMLVMVEYFFLIAAPSAALAWTFPRDIVASSILSLTIVCGCLCYLMLLCLRKMKEMPFDAAGLAVSVLSGGLIGASLYPQFGAILGARLELARNVLGTIVLFFVSFAIVRGSFLRQSAVKNIKSPVVYAVFALIGLPTAALPWVYKFDFFPTAVQTLVAIWATFCGTIVTINMMRFAAFKATPLPCVISFVLCIAGPMTAQLTLLARSAYAYRQGLTDHQLAIGGFQFTTRHQEFRSMLVRASLLRKLQISNDSDEDDSDMIDENLDYGELSLRLYRRVMRSVGIQFCRFAFFQAGIAIPAGVLSGSAWLGGSFLPIWRESLVSAIVATLPP